MSRKAAGNKAIVEILGDHRVGEIYPSLHKRIVDDIASCGSVEEFVAGINVSWGENDTDTKLWQLAKLGRGVLHASSPLAAAIARRYMEPGQSLAAVFEEIFPRRRFKYTRRVNTLLNPPPPPPPPKTKEPTRAGFSECAAMINETLAQGKKWGDVHTLLPLALWDKVTVTLLQRVVKGEDVPITLRDGSFEPIVGAVRHLALRYRGIHKIKGDLSEEKVAADLKHHIKECAASPTKTPAPT